MPPAVISVNECGPLRDEGIMFGKKMAKAGVDLMTCQVMSTCHGGDVLSGRDPIMNATLCDMSFAETCCRQIQHPGSY
jgi:acetyl esterase/lipase